MLSDFYPPLIGGMERYVQTLSKSLVRNGHKVTVCTMGHERPSEITAEKEEKIYRIEGFFQKIPVLFGSSERKYPPPTQDWLITNKLKNIIKQEDPDIIHAHDWMVYSALPLIRTMDVPLVVTLHNYGFICPKKTCMKNVRRCDPFTPGCVACGREAYGIVKSFLTYSGVKLNRDHLKSVRKFIAVSSAVGDVYSKYLGLNDETITVIRNFYENKKIIQSSRAYEAIPEDFILFVGALSKHKGIDVLVQAYERIDTRTKLLIIGRSEPSFNYHSTGNITVINDAPDEIVSEAYSRCRFVIIPSIWPEPFGIVALEAMSYKKAIIASRIGGLEEIVNDGVTGVHVQPNNVGKLAEAMVGLLHNSKDGERMGDNGFEVYMNRYTPAVVVPLIEKVYKGVL